MKDQRFYDVAEVAAILRVSKMTIYRQIHTQKIAAVHIRDRWIIPASAIDAAETAALINHREA
jgi:excisionase family DNA binding protein